MGVAEEPKEVQEETVISLYSVSIGKPRKRAFAGSTQPLSKTLISQGFFFL